MITNDNEICLGIALSHNPIGLAAYLLEKYSAWTDPYLRTLPDGGWSRFDRSYKDAILDNIMIYYLSGCITTSCRFFSEALAYTEAGFELARVPTLVPTACARFRNDLMHTMDWQLRNKYPMLIQSTYHQVGGHFVAMEQPALLAADLIKFVRSVNRNKLNKLRGW